MATAGTGKEIRSTVPQAPVYEVKPPPGASARVKFSVEQLKSSYVNFANANSTKEEVVINFGFNSNWDRVNPEMEIALEHRVVMNPHAARRLSELLAKLMTEYQARYGELT